MNTLTESKEDYLEAILVIGLEKKWVRVRDLAKYLGVKMSSVAAAVKFLAEKGLINHERYGYIELTKNGAVIAEEIYTRHKTLYKFLHDLLGLSKAVASREACKIEHTLDAKTMKRLLKFIEFVETCPEEEPLWLSNFHYFIKTGRHLGRCDRRDTNKVNGE